MSETTCHVSISLDGFAAGPDQSREHPLGRRDGVADPQLEPVEVIHSPLATHARYRVSR